MQKTIIIGIICIIIGLFIGIIINQINPNKCYENYIKNLSTNVNGKVLNLNEEYPSEAYNIIKETIILGTDKKLYIEDLDNENATTIPLGITNEEETYKGNYIGIDNVIDFFYGQYGNGFGTYFIILKNDGFLYEVNLEPNSNFNTTKLEKYTNIVNIYSTIKNNGYEVYGIDIDGNIKNMELSY